ncbi:glycosyltransferase involved in cell wall biosynthesis [Bacilli bacterium PM5-3]|nr:glycosyltransferase involved in cell wall biosynthesis [Bacilli bacterium PM5-3]
MNEITISTVVLSYNNEEYIVDCLQSIVDQKIEKYEVIIVDDSSTDNSINVINNFIKDKPQFHLIEKENEGGAISSQVGIANAKGKYLSIIDCDDIVYENAYKNLIAAIERENADFATGKPVKLVESYRFAYTSGDESKIFTSPKVLETIEERLELTNTVFYWNSVYKTDFIKNNKVKMPDNLLIADRVFLYKAIISAKRIAIIDDIVYIWRRKYNDKKLSITDKQNSYPIISDRIDSFEVQLLMLLDNEETSIGMVKGVFEKSLKRLFYPLYECIKDEELSKNDYNLICDRYHYFFMNYISFFQHLLYNSDILALNKLIIEKIINKDYECIKEYINNYTLDTLDVNFLKNLSFDVYNAFSMENSNSNILELEQVDERIVAKYNISNERKLLKVFTNTRFIENNEYNLEVDYENKLIDLTNLPSTSYILRNKYVDSVEERYGVFCNNSEYTRLLTIENSHKTYVFHPKSSILNIYDKNKFSIFANGKKLYLHINLPEYINELFFYNVNSNKKIKLSFSQSNTILLDFDKLLDGNNILLYENADKCYCIINKYEMTNNDDYLQSTGLFSKSGRLEIKVEESE